MHTTGANMARRKDVKNIGLQLTDEEFAALDAFCQAANRDKAVIIRAALAACIPDYPADAWVQGDDWQERWGYSFEEKVKK
jgi:hypothetical protein